MTDALARSTDRTGERGVEWVTAQLRAGDLYNLLTPPQVAKLVGLAEVHRHFLAGAWEAPACRCGTSDPEPCFGSRKVWSETHGELVAWMGDYEMREVVNRTCVGIPARVEDLLADLRECVGSKAYLAALAGIFREWLYEVGPEGDLQQWKACETVMLESFRRIACHKAPGRAAAAFFTGSYAPPIATALLTQDGTELLRWAREPRLDRLSGTILSDERARHGARFGVLSWAAGYLLGGLHVEDFGRA